MGGTYVRVNLKDKLEFVELSLSSLRNLSFRFNLKEQNYSLNDINSYWFRRGNINLKQFNPELNKTDDLQDEIAYRLSEDQFVLEQIIFNLFESKRSLGSRDKAIVNKLTVLFRAQALGIDIPKTKILTQSEQALSFLQFEKNNVITKAVTESIMLPDKIGSREYYVNYTEKVYKEDFKRSESFFPSLFQEALDKKFELRIFYLAGKFFSMAIFSQLDEQTSVDFREYNYKKPNRTVPFNLPELIKDKLKKLMSVLNLDTGSIDMVVTKNERYVFLEVNPVGQFGMVSKPCNYRIEKEISKYLLNK